jgi:hypothetical protein
VQPDSAGTTQQTQNPDNNLTPASRKPRTNPGPPENPKSLARTRGPAAQKEARDLTISQISDNAASPARRAGRARASDAARARWQLARCAEALVLAKQALTEEQLARELCATGPEVHSAVGLLVGRGRLERCGDYLVPTGSAGAV